MAKEAIRGLTRTAAREWGPDNIRINVICPAGLTEGTAAFLEANPDMKAKGEALVPLRRIGDPERDIGAFVAALVSDDMAYLTGATINLDGGKHFIN
jgi:NAD(P)-dependent dehydrogenase (short-subunit alcohol dehydrogenase family)